MNVKFACSIAIGISLVMAAPAFAKTKAKARGGKITGVYCAQGADNVFIPATSIKASLRNRLYKGQKIKFNDPGYGPVDCVAY